ncbi:RagB/SusD family nutrient uptake outer membrane protein [Chitinophaga sp. MM2321]|uniref:RagB/SusD family nutrient uptake outer membrane protein n=1 Tax=Chitinophaga sp. MM2321 TaxID=3137178 RepID=UPI0032D5ABB0
MKTIKYTLVIILAAVQLSGCKKFLDSVPYSTISAEQFYHTAADAEKAINGCYSPLNENSMQGRAGGLYFHQLPVMLTASTDEAVKRFNLDNAKFGPWGIASWSSSSEMNQEAYFCFYAAIGRCNILLDKLDGINMPDARKEEIVAEARFLRGVYYMHLGMMYGGVPLVTNAELDVDGPRKPLQEVFLQVIADLDFAYQHLSPRASISGRANKWSAAGFLARTYAFLGSSKLNSVGADLNFPLNSFDWVNSDEAYTHVKTLTDDIITSGGYKLTAKYGYLFMETTKSYQQEECLFVIESSEDPLNGNYFNSQNQFFSSGAVNTYGGGAAQQVPLGELWTKYNANDTRRGWNLTGAYTNKSVKETVDGAVYYAPIAVTDASIKTGYFYAGKFRAIDPATKKIDKKKWAGNYPMLRLAEIYLLRAEAVFYLTGDVVTATSDLVTVRQRAIPAANLTAVNTAYKKADFVAELLDERARELCFESLRHIDLMRFDRYQSAINSLSDGKTVSFNNQMVPTFKLNWASYRIWFPIPLNELVLNKNLVQNPGY